MHLRKMAMSPEQALNVLDSMYKVYLRDKNNVFKISRVVKLTKLQENILRAVDKKLVQCSV
jgi:hypothetical protein